MNIVNKFPVNTIAEIFTEEGLFGQKLKLLSNNNVVIITIDIVDDETVRLIYTYDNIPKDSLFEIVDTSSVPPKINLISFGPIKSSTGKGVSLKCRVNK